jgi:GNAT superfamily N-acetyltransferase
MPAPAIRLATVDDVPVICAQRRAMFEDMGIRPRVPHDQSIPAFAAWVTPRIASGEYLGFLTERAGQVLAGAGLWLMPWPPTPHGIAQRRGYVLNVYTSPAARGRGLARGLMESTLTRAAAEGVEVVTLHASEAGRPLYEAMSFVATNEMRLILTTEAQR